MLGKAFLLGGMLVSFGANAAVIDFDVNDIDPTNATTVLQLPSQNGVFNFAGYLNTGGEVQTNQNPGDTFGLYLGSTLLKPLSSFTFDSTNVGYSFDFKNLAAGSYTLRFNINGNATARAFDLTSTITPVPEPESFALMAVGLGILGLIARRKA